MFAAVVGQRFYGESGPSFLHIGLKFEYTEVNVAQNKLGLNVQLPFGITVREDLDCIPISSTQCRVNYHCSNDSSSSVANPAIIPSRYIARCKARIVPHFRTVECQRICSPDY